MSLRHNCPWCEQVIRLRRDGTLVKHKIPKATSWDRRPRPDCPGSHTKAKNNA